MIDHALVQLALRTRAMTLSVCTTGTTSLSATTTGYARAAGSFVTDGFQVGMEVTPVGFTTNVPKVITAVAALSLTVEGGASAQTAGSRSLTVGFPALFALENSQFTPTPRRWFAEEDFTPGANFVRSMPPSGGIREFTGIYMLRLYPLQEHGFLGPRKVADALLALFLGGSTLSLSNGDTLRIMEQPAPRAGEQRPDERGWSVIPITIPWRLYTFNN